MSLQVLSLQKTPQILTILMLHKHFTLFSQTYHFFLTHSQIKTFFFSNKPMRIFRPLDKLNWGKNNEKNANKIKLHAISWNKFITCFFLLNFKSTNNFFLLHHEYFFAGVQRCGLFFSIDGVIFFHRWRQGVSFLLSFFHLQPRFLMLGTESFLKETNAFNWGLFSKEPGFWKYYKNFFLIKNNYINQVTNSFYRKLKKRQLDCIFIYDTYYHFKNLYYLRKMRFFVVGLTHQRVSPWLLSYSFLVVNDSLIAQFFFLHILNLTRKTATRSIFLQKHISWFINSKNLQQKNILI